MTSSALTASTSLSVAQPPGAKVGLPAFGQDVTSTCHDLTALQMASNRSLTATYEWITEVQRDISASVIDSDQALQWLGDLLLASTAIEIGMNKQVKAYANVVRPFIVTYAVQVLREAEHATKNLNITRNAIKVRQISYQHSLNQTLQRARERPHDLTIYQITPQTPAAVTSMQRGGVCPSSVYTQSDPGMPAGVTTAAAVNPGMNPSWVSPTLLNQSWNKIPEVNNSWASPMHNSQPPGSSTNIPGNPFNRQPPPIPPPTYGTPPPYELDKQREQYRGDPNGFGQQQNYCFLEPIKLTPFSGHDVSKYKAFKLDFIAFIHNRDIMPVRDKMAYLLSLTSGGPAHDLISYLTRDAAGYLEALAELDADYGNLDRQLT
jgi:hypothetical protein